MQADTVPTGDTHPSELPADLSSSNAKLVYVYLSQVEEATLSQLASALDMTLLSLVPTVRSLERDGFVVRTGERCRFVDEGEHRLKAETKGAADAGPPRST